MNRQAGAGSRNAGGRQPPADVAELAFRSFVRTSGLFRNLMEPHFARFGVSGAQWGVLRALARAEDEGLAGLRLGELGRRVLVKPPSVTSLVDRLERLGLVGRHAVADDLRATQVSLTEKGRALIVGVLVHHPAQMRKMLGGLNEAQQRSLYELLEQLAGHLETLTETSESLESTAPVSEE